MLSLLPRASIQRPWTVIGLATLLAALLVPGVTRLQLRTDGNALVPSGHPAIEADRRVRAWFSVGDEILVVVEATHPKGIFNPGSLQTVARLTADLGAIEGIDERLITSLATERGMRVRPGTLTFRRLLEPLPRTADELAELRSDLHELRLYVGTLVSADDRAASILLSIPAGADRGPLVRAVHDVVVRHRGGADRIHIAGAPVAESLLGTHLMADLGVPSRLIGALDVADHDGGIDDEPALRRLRRVIAGHVGLLPIAIAIMAIVFLVSYRRPAAALLPLLEVGSCLAIVFGCMGWVGVPVYLTTAVMPVVLTAVGVADEIHLFNRYRQLAAASDDRRAVVRATMDDMTRPITRTSLTTALAFGTFALSPIDAVSWFGIFTAFGILICLLFSLAVVPACLVLLPARLLVPAGPSDAATSRLAGAVATAAIRHRRLVLMLALLLVVPAVIGAVRIRVQDSWIDGFAPGSPFRRVTETINERFLGTHVLRLCVEGRHQEQTGTLLPSAVRQSTVELPLDPLEAAALPGRWIRITAAADDGAPAFPPESRARFRSPLARILTAEPNETGVVVTTAREHGSLPVTPPPGDERPHTFRITSRPLLDVEVTNAICELESMIQTHDELEVGGVIGPCDYLETTSYITRRERIVPDTAVDLVLAWKHYHSRSRTPQRPRSVIDADHRGGLIAVLMENANFQATATLIDRIRVFAADRLAPLGLTITLAGDVAVSQTLIDAIVTTQVRSLMLSLACVLLVTTLLHRSLGWGLICVLPCAFAVLANHALMGWMGIPLGVATSMFSAMTIGIGVDYAIHLTHRARVAAAAGAGPRRAFEDAARQTGPALIVDAVAIIAGFGVMSISQVPANARLGLLVAMSVAGCLIATLVLIPALAGRR